MSFRDDADVCLILEGTYPYVSGGVSSWAHQLIQSQSHLRFHLLSIMPPNDPLDLKYTLPSNVSGVTNIGLGKLPTGRKSASLHRQQVHARLHESLNVLTSNQALHVNHLRQLLEAISYAGDDVGSHILLDCEEAWEHLVELYEDSYAEHSFLDFFWSYRAIVGGIFSILNCRIPRAGIYHAMSTGYAGLMAARAKVEFDRPAFITEHGIYTNERRIEVTSADWLEETSSKALTVDETRRDLRDLWIDAINNFSRVAYQASDRIITLFEGNQHAQLEDGADPNRMQIIPNGVNVAQYASLPRNPQPKPTIALIGRVVPIKDIKTFIRAMSQLSQQLPDFQAYIMGPMDEDPHYYDECVKMVSMLGLEQKIEFTGRVDVEDYLPRIDVLVLTSISEAQPLVMLEAGACGIPMVATDVGACREIIEGSTDEDDAAIGHCGYVIPLASPQAAAEGIINILADKERYATFSKAASERIERFYNLPMLNEAYQSLYGAYLK